MRLCAMLFVCAAIGAAQSVPADPHELVSGKDDGAAHPIDRAAGLALINRAKAPMRFHAPNTPPHLLVASFTAAGGPGHSGSGEIQELWLPPPQGGGGATLRHTLLPP